MTSSRDEKDTDEMSKEPQPPREGSPIRLATTDDGQQPAAPAARTVHPADIEITPKRLPSRPGKTQMKAAPPKATSDVLGTIYFGASVILVTFFGFGLWAATAPLASAVGAPATLAVEGQRRAVQHLEGGIVAKINVKEGDLVEAGDVLILLDAVSAAAAVQRLRTQLDTQLANEARLVAERDGTDDVAFPKDLTERATIPAVGIILDGQRQQFRERRISLTGQIGLLQGKIEQLGSQIGGLEQQHAAQERQSAILTDEIASLRPLLERGLVARPRVLALERENANLEGSAAEITASTATARQQIGEAKLQIEQTRQTFREEVIASLREAESRVADLSQQYLVAFDVLDRLEIRAPQSGIIQNQHITTVGGVIAPGQTLMEIAPTSDELLIQAHVSPQDVANVTVGQEAEVRFVSLDLRRTPEITGEVVTLSGDRLYDESTNTPYFLAQVRTHPDEMKKLEGQRIHAGMPAEVFIKTGERTLVEYLIKPLTDAIARGMNET